MENEQFLGIGNPTAAQYQRRANRQAARAANAQVNGNQKRYERLTNKSNMNQAYADAGYNYAQQQTQQPNPAPQPQNQDIAGQAPQWSTDTTRVMKFQTWANQNGLSQNMPVDGKWGPKTQSAWDMWCNQQNGQQQVSEGKVYISESELKSIIAECIGEIISKRK